jgi:hypothetical protein
VDARDVVRDLHGDPFGGDLPDQIRQVNGLDEFGIDGALETLHQLDERS